MVDLGLRRRHLSDRAAGFRCGPIWAWIGLGLAPTPIALIGGAVVLAGVMGHAALGLAEDRRARRMRA